MAEITPLNLIPADWDPSDQLPHWLDISPNFTLPVGHVHNQSPNRDTWTVAQSLTKGVTHWSRQHVGDELGGLSDFRAAYPDNEYNDVPRIRDMFDLNYDGGWWPNGYYNESQARAKGQSVSISPRLWIGETMEGDDYVPEGEAMWAWFYEELRARYDARYAIDNIPFFIAHNYFTRMGNVGNNVYNLGEGNQAEHEALYSMPVGSWPSNVYTPGGTLSHTNTIIFDGYFNEPESVPKRLYGHIFCMELAKKMGYYSGMFWFDMHEWHPGFATNVYLEDGTFERSDKAALDPNTQLLLPIIAHEWGNVSVDWGIWAKRSSDKTKIADISEYMPGKDRWYPGGGTSTASYPNYYYGGDYYLMPAYLADITHFGLRGWVSTGGQTVGGTDYYCTYRLDGGPWVQKTPTGCDVVKAYYDPSRWLVKARLKDNKLSVCAFNLYADNQPHVLEFQHPTNSGITFTMPVCGNGAHIQLINL